MKIKKTGRKALSLLIAVMMLMSLVPLSTFTASALSGNGTYSNPYLISTVQDLFDFRERVADGEQSACAKLMNDIAFNTGTSYNADGYTGDEPVEWKPIGATMGTKYKGVFDGNGYYVSGLYNKSTWTNEIGFFGYTDEGAVIKNLTIKDSFIWGESYVGALIGKANKTTVTNCHNYSTYVKAADKLGGLIGAAYSCTVTGCSSKVDQPDKYTILNYDPYCEMGGIIGNFQLGTISDCVNESNLKAEGDYCPLGGIVGLTTGGVIQRCVQTGKFSYFTDYDTGGIVGNFGTTHGLTDGNLFIEDCLVLNSIQLIGELTYSGGWVVENDTTTYIRNCYTDGCLLYDLFSNQNANISNSFYGNKIARVDKDRSNYELFITENVNKATESMVKSGEVAYRLRQTSSRASWGQQIGTDEYPVLNGPRVYYGYENCQSTEENYSNDVRYEKQGVGHQYNEMGACSLCGARGGSEEYPYPILTAEDLKKFADAVNGGASTLCAKLMNDIDLNPGTTFNISDGTYSGNTPTEWTPMGTKDYPYCGTFDGAGHKISGLYVHRIANYSGLFGYCEATDGKTPVIKNLSVDNSSINVTHIYSTGGIVGYISGGTISNCSSSAYVYNDSSNAYSGGIAGEAVDSIISTCSNSSTVTSYLRAGGIDGYGVNNTISECYNTGEVKVYDKGSSFVGGISGVEANESSLINVYNTGNIYLYYDSSSGTMFGGGSIGGIAGFGGCYIANGYNTGELNCINTSGSGITPNFYKGAAVGQPGSKMEINNFYYSDAELPLCSGGQAITSQNTGVKTAEQFASGEVAYLLNGNISDGDLAWGQELGTDSYPVLGGKTVYYGTNCAGTNLYSNEPVSSEHNFISMNGKCAVCGLYEDEMSALYGHSITLDGKVGLNYFMEIDDDYANENTTMNFSVINNVSETGQLNVLYSQSVPLTDDAKVIYDGKTYYKFTCSLAAKEMTCGVKAQLVNGDKEGTAFYYNVAEYAYTLLNDESFDTKTKELVISMLNYGANSQTYFDFVTDYLANCDLPGELTQLEDTQADELSAYKSSYTPDESYTGSASYYGSSLVLKSNTEIKHYFAYDSEKTCIDNFTCTDSEGKSYDIAESGSYLYVRVDNIPAHQLGEALTLSLYENDVKVGEISYSPLSYAYSVLSAYPTDDGTHDNVRNVVKSLYQYNNKAVAYKAV